MLLLPTEYKKYGYIYKQVDRRGDVAIYTQTDRETNQLHAFEVFIVQKQPDAIIYNRSYPAKELAPGTGQWGQEAYTVHTMEQAYEKMAKLQAKLDNRELETESVVVINEEDPFGGLNF